MFFLCSFPLCSVVLIPHCIHQSWPFCCPLAFFAQPLFSQVKHGPSTRHGVVACLDYLCGESPRTRTAILCGLCRPLSSFILTGISLSASHSQHARGKIHVLGKKRQSSHLGRSATQCDPKLSLTSYPTVQYQQRTTRSDWNRLRVTSKAVPSWRVEAASEWSICLTRAPEIWSCGDFASRLFSLSPQLTANTRESTGLLL